MTENLRPSPSEVTERKEPVVPEVGPLAEIARARKEIESHLTDNLLVPLAEHVSPDGPIAEAGLALAEESRQTYGILAKLDGLEKYVTRAAELTWEIEGGRAKVSEADDDYGRRAANGANDNELRLLGNELNAKRARVQAAEGKLINLGESVDLVAARENLRKEIKKQEQENEIKAETARLAELRRIRYEERRGFTPDESADYRVLTRREQTRIEEADLIDAREKLGKVQKAGVEYEEQKRLAKLAKLEALVGKKGEPLTEEEEKQTATLEAEVARRADELAKMRQSNAKAVFKGDESYKYTSFNTERYQQELDERRKALDTLAQRRSAWSSEGGQGNEIGHQLLGLRQEKVEREEAKRAEQEQAERAAAEEKTRAEEIYDGLVRQLAGVGLEEKAGLTEVLARKTNEETERNNKERVLAAAREEADRNEQERLARQAKLDEEAKRKEEQENAVKKQAKTLIDTHKKWADDVTKAEAEAERKRQEEAERQRQEEKRKEEEAKRKAEEERQKREAADRVEEAAATAARDRQVEEKRKLEAEQNVAAERDRLEKEKMDAKRQRYLELMAAASRGGVIMGGVEAKNRVKMTDSDWREFRQLGKELHVSALDRLKQSSAGYLKKLTDNPANILFFLGGTALAAGTVALGGEAGRAVAGFGGEVIGTAMGVAVNALAVLRGTEKIVRTVYSGISKIAERFSTSDQKRVLHERVAADFGGACRSFSSGMVAGTVVAELAFIPRYLAGIRDMIGRVNPADIQQNIQPAVDSAGSGVVRQGANAARNIPVDVETARTVTESAGRSPEILGGLGDFVRETAASAAEGVRNAGETARKVVQETVDTFRPGGMDQAVEAARQAAASAETATQAAEGVVHVVQQGESFWQILNDKHIFIIDGSSRLAEVIAENSQVLTEAAKDYDRGAVEAIRIITDMVKSGKAVDIRGDRRLYEIAMRAAHWVRAGAELVIK